MTGRSDYATRRAERIGRLAIRAERKRLEAERRLEAVQKIADQIPLGQPILVGHHSERHARRDAKRIQDGMRRGVEALGEAEELARRATAAEANQAISSDDPEAVQRLEEKLKAVEARRDRWKAINRALRTKDRAALDALALTDEERRSIALSVCGTGYAVTNASAEVRRIRQRIAELRAKEAAPARAPETIGRVVIEEAENRVRMRFPGKPAPDVIRVLKAHGFHWARTDERWQRYASEAAWRAARSIAEQAAGRGLPPS